MPDTETRIDKIEIEIDASATKANKAIEDLEKNLRGLKGAMTGFNTSAIDNLATKLEKAASAMDKLASKMSNVSKSGVTPKVDTSNVSSAEKKISRDLEKIQDKFVRLGSLADAAMGGDSSALTSFSRKATSLQGDIDVLGEKLKRLGDTRVQSDSFKELESKIQSTDSYLKTLQADLRNVQSGNVQISDDAFTKLKSEVANTIQELDTLIAKQREMIKDGSAYTDPYQGIRDGLLQVQTDLDSTTAKVQEANSEMSQAPTMDTSEPQTQLSLLGEKATEVANKFMSMAGSNVLNGLKSVTSAFSGIKSKISEVSNKMGKLSGVFDKGFMRVLKYGFGIRSIYVGFRRLRKAVIESFGELQKSGAFFETTRNNIQNLKKSLSTLKFQFGAAFEPIFNAVAPALQTLIDYLIQAMNVFSAFTAKLMGKDTYSRAVASSGAVASNVGSAAKSAKELNKQLQGFDELNNLTSNTPSSGGGGGGGAGSGSGVTYVEESVDNVLGDFGKELARLIREGDWEAVGTAISEKLTEQLNKINWNKLKAKAAGFGKGLGQFINGLITPNLFSALGTTIGEAINTALTGTQALGDTIKWENIGNSVAAGINAFVKTNPLKLVVSNFNTWAIGILDALNAAITGTDWETIGNHIADAIANVKVWSITWRLGTLVSNMLDAIYDIVKKPETWTGLGQKIADGINGWSKGFKGDKLAKAANAIANGLWNALGQAIVGIHWGDIADDIIGALGNLDIGTISLIAAVAFAPTALAGIKTAITTILTTTVAGMGGVSVGTIAVSAIASVAIGWKIGNKIYEQATGTEVEGGMADQLKEVFSGLFGKDKIKFDLSEFIEFTFGESNPWNDYFGEIGDEAWEKTLTIKTKFEDTKATLKSKWEDIKSGVGDITANIKTAFSETKDSLTKKWNDLKSNIKDITANVGLAIATKWSDLKSKWETLIGNFKNISKTVSLAIGTKWDDIKTKWTNLTDNFKNVQKYVYLGIGSTWNNLKNRWNNLKKKFTGKTVYIRLALSATVASIKSWINTHIINNLNSALHKVPIFKNVNVPQLKAEGGVTNKPINTIWGERGSEALIPLEHNLNGIKKIATVMLNGMADVSKYRSIITPESLGFSEYSPYANNGVYSSSGDSELIQEQNRLLAEQNRLLQQIANKDFSVSSRDIFDANMKEANNYYKRTGNSAFVF